jgi:hypothetical protein
MTSAIRDDAHVMQAGMGQQFAGTVKPRAAKSRVWMANSSSLSRCSADSCVGINGRVSDDLERIFVDVIFVSPRVWIGLFFCSAISKEKNLIAVIALCVAI